MALALLIQIYIQIETTRHADRREHFTREDMLDEIANRYPARSLSDIGN
jgi:hypothetical protein